MDRHRDCLLSLAGTTPHIPAPSRYSILILTRRLKPYPSSGKISRDLLDQVLGAALGERVNVIVQSNGPWSPLLDTVIALTGGQSLPATAILI